MSLESSSGSKRRRFKDEAFLFPENAEVISLDDDEDEVKIDESGLDSENPITIWSDEEEEDDVIFGKDENLVFLDDSDEDDDDDDDGDDESEEDETSDEDFKVDELNEASDDDGDVDSYEDEQKKIKRKRMRKYFDVVEELEREVMMDKESGISVNNE
ncbi:hypothetical protein QL285_093637 [Trifolium repens]|nr:hypothetical protein QL285_093637 [Trifolium repens]